MRTIHQILFILFVCFSSCGENPPKDTGSSSQTNRATPEDSLFHEVLQGHDEGMAKISRIRKYSSRLKSVIDSLNSNPKGNESELATLRRVKDSLDAANASMFSWMDGFKADTLTGRSAERMRYLEDQKASVTVVRDQIRNSLRLYDSIHKKYQ